MQILEQAYAGTDIGFLTSRIRETLNDIRTKGIIQTKCGECITGYKNHELFDWDMYFENIFMSYFGPPDFMKNSVLTYLDLQEPSGFIPRTARYVYNVVDPTKPFLAQSAMLYINQTGDTTWLCDDVVYRLELYLEHWFDAYDNDGNGLCYYDGSYHSGMDNQVLRLGALEYCKSIEGVDLNCFLYRDLAAMSEIFARLGRDDRSRDYRGRAERLAARINDAFWCEGDGFYYDRDERDGKQVRARSIAGFMPLWAGIATKAQADIMVRRHLLSEDEFWTPYPVATWARNEEGYFQKPEDSLKLCSWMGATWMPTNYMIFHSLTDYGYTGEAKYLAGKSCELVLKNERTREFYDGEDGEGLGLDPFWGWSSLGYIMPLEHALNYNPSSLVNRSVTPLGKKFFGISL